MENASRKMKYNRLGKSGISVSSISLGFGDILDQDRLTQLLKAGYDAGINYFDHAELYGKGKVETLFGNALKELKIPRQELVISTKVFWGPTSEFGPKDQNSTNRYNPNDIGLSRKHIIEGLQDSLKRLQLDYVDIVFAHRFDPDTPLEEIVRAFDYVINKGWALYWGTSSWPAKKIWEAIGICEKLGLHKPVVEQPEYNLMARKGLEDDYVELFDEYGLGTTVWSPLNGGVLTGKYNKEIPQDSRYKSSWVGFIYEQWLGEKNIDETRKKLVALENIAKEVGITQAQLALAWVLKNKDVSTCLIGSSKVEQLKENLKALEFVDKITEEVEKKINAIFPGPPLGLDPKSFTPLKPRRG